MIMKFTIYFIYKLYLIYRYILIPYAMPVKSIIYHVTIRKIEIMNV